jgi:CHAT domain-containing protein
MVHFMDSQSRVYVHMILLQLALRNPEIALAYVERHKARALLDVLTNGNAGVTKAMSAEDQERELAFKRTLTRLDSQILAESNRPAPDRKHVAELAAQREQARSAYRAFVVQLYAAHPQLQVQRVAIEPVRPAELAASLPDPDTALLEYVVCDSHIYLFVVTRATDASQTPQFHVYRLPAPADSLMRDTRVFRDKLAARDLSYAPLARSLYLSLLAPAAAQLRGRTTLVISPDGALWQTPFQALQPTPGHYLLEDRAVILTPSLSVFHAMRKAHPERLARHPYVLAMQAAQLPSAGREAAGIRELYGGDHTRVYSPADADEEHMRRDAGKFQVLHIAAHGVFEDRNPMNSYLVLAKDGKPEAGVWDARAMMDLDLHADLVVLSGCETGRGSTGNAEGILGMAWALFVAGSPSLVASQWKVASDATTQLMLGFHANLKTASQADALRQAALAVMKTPAYHHPFYWSGFVLMGLGF